LRAARDETAAAEARVEVAERELLPIPSVQLGRTWTSGPFGAANFVGIQSEIPLSSDRRALADKAKAQAQAARERERATGASLRAEYRRQKIAIDPDTQRSFWTAGGNGVNPLPIISRLPGSLTPALPSAILSCSGAEMRIPPEPRSSASARTGSASAAPSSAQTSTVPR